MKSKKFQSFKVSKFLYSCEVEEVSKFLSFKNLNLNLNQACVCQEVVHSMRSNELQRACVGPWGHSSPLGCVLG